MERELYHSNAMLGLNPLTDDSEAMHFHFGKLTGDSKDFFNCDTPIGLDYPDRSALQPICVHFDSGDGTNDGEKADENVELLDISSKRLPVDLGFNGLDKTTIQINGNYTSSQLVVNSPPTSESGSAESNDYINLQCNDNYMRADYTNQVPSVDNERVFYNNNHLYYSNHYHEQPHDNLNHHQSHQSHQIYHRNHLNVNHTTHQQNYHIHYQNYQQQPSTPIHYYQHYQPQAKQQSFQRYHHRKHTPHKAPQKPIQKPPQSPPKITKLVKHKQRQQTQTSTQVRTPPQPQPQPQSQPKPQSKSQVKVQPSLKRKHYRRNHIKALEEKPVLNQPVVQKPKLGRPRKYNYSPPKPVKFRSNRLRLKVQSENLESEQDSESIPESSKNSDAKKESKKEKEQEILPVEWDRPENLSFDRNNVSDFEKASLPEFFAGKYDRTHFHPSQYLQIRNIFLDEWESRKPNTVRFREMIRVHKGIGNVVSFSRVCKFLTAIGAINDVDKDDTIVTGNKDEDSCNLSLPSIEDNQDNQNKVNDEESEEPKESLQAPSSSSSPSPSPSPPSLSSSIEANTLSPSATPSEDSMLQTAAPRPRRGRKRKSYFLNEMTRLGIDPAQAGFPIPENDKEKDEVQETINENDDKSNEMDDLPESVQSSP